MHAITRRAIPILFVLLISSCSEQVRQTADTPDTSPTVVEVTAIYEPETNRHLFLTDVEVVPAGWTTFRLLNASPMAHFIFLDHLPGDRTSVDLLSEVSPIFQEVADQVRAGQTVEEASAKFAELPEWFPEIVFRGGPGFLSPGLISEATLYLEPGNYVLECYIKTGDGVFHWNLGMHLDLRVTDEISEAEPPADPSIQITITDEGLQVEGEASPGDHLVAVHFQEESDALVKNDVHLVRLEDDTDLESVARWMDFFQPEGGVSTAERPAPARFLGGVHEMPLGNTAYFPVSLEPGNYAWISEQPVANAHYFKFSVSSEGPD